jgi:archaetidylinositol phosphate synthase
VPRRVSRSLLDPSLLPVGRTVYRALSPPRWLPPEGIILLGHLSALAAAAGFALSPLRWWGGVVAALGVAGNHFADMIDGTHARATGQCRNGGELLDHFIDPISFSAWMIGMGVGAGVALESGWLGLGLAIPCVVLLFSIAVLTSIRAKMTGEFVLHAFGPTEFKTILVLHGCAMAVLVGLGAGEAVAGRVLAWTLGVLAAVGVLTLGWSLAWSVRLVNRTGAPPDTSEWAVCSRERSGDGG